jgi:hypothetical protein
MWIPAGIIYLAAALMTMRTWLRESEWYVVVAEGRGTPPPAAAQQVQ